MLSAEVAAPSVIPNDFSFSRFVIQIERHQRIFRSGITTVSLLGGIGLGTVPPQRYFTIDAGVRALGFQGSGFRTLDDSSFAGNRIAMLSVRHDFDQLLFAESGLPLVRRLPFTLSIYAATFDLRFAYHEAPFRATACFARRRRRMSRRASSWGTCCHSCAPLNVGAQFTWQLSAQSERRFQFEARLAGTVAALVALARSRGAGALMGAGADHASRGARFARGRLAVSERCRRMAPRRRPVQGGTAETASPAALRAREVAGAPATRSPPATLR